MSVSLEPLEPSNLPYHIYPLQPIQALPNIMLFQHAPRGSPLEYVNETIRDAELTHLCAKPCPKNLRSYLDTGNPGGPHRDSTPSSIANRKELIRIVPPLPQILL